MSEEMWKAPAELSDRQIQGSYDRCSGESAFIIADVTTDDAWVAIATGDELAVSEWR